MIAPTVWQSPREYARPSLAAPLKVVHLARDRLVVCVTLRGTGPGFSVQVGPLEAASLGPDRLAGRRASLCHGGNGYDEETDTLGAIATLYRLLFFHCGSVWCGWIPDLFVPSVPP